MSVSRNDDRIEITAPMLSGEVTVAIEFGDFSILRWAQMAEFAHDVTMECEHVTIAYSHTRGEFSVRIWSGPHVVAVRFAITDGFRTQFAATVSTFM
jgi:hypothetical protein